MQPHPQFNQGCKMEEHMADYYELATVEPPCLPKGLFAEDDLEILRVSGFEWEDNGDSYYFYAPLNVSEDDERSRTYYDVFQSAISQSQGEIDEIVIQGAITCSKMRPGAFGGFVIRITKDDMQCGGTSAVIGLMRSGRWPLD